MADDRRLGRRHGDRSAAPLRPARGVAAPAAGRCRAGRLGAHLRPLPGAGGIGLGLDDVRLRPPRSADHRRADAVLPVRDHQRQPARFVLYAGQRLCPARHHLRGGAASPADHGHAGLLRAGHRVGPVRPDDGRLHPRAVANAQRRLPHPFREPGAGRGAHRAEGRRPKTRGGAPRPRASPSRSSWPRQATTSASRSTRSACSRPRSAASSSTTRAGGWSATSRTASR